MARRRRQLAASPSHEGMLRYWDSLTLKKIGRMSREEAIDLLSWQDPNGCYRDGECGDDVEPMTLHEAHAALWKQVKAGGGKLEGLRQAETPTLPEAPRKRYRWLWVLAAAGVGVAAVLIVRRVLVARKPPGVTQTDRASSGAPAAQRPEKVAVLGD
jgi:hypothetical protein